MRGADFLFSRLLTAHFKKENDEAGEGARKSDETVRLNIPVVEAKNREVLYAHAKKHIESRKIGEVEIYVRPFTKQVRSDLRLLHGVLKPFFDEADRTSKEVVRTAMRLRAITLLFFCIYVFYGFLALQKIATAKPGSGAGASPDNLANQFAHVPILFWLPPIIAFFVVGLFRYSQIREIKTKAGDFGGTFNGNLQLLNNKASFALERVSDDEPTAEGCEQRAEEWTSVALWLFDLYAVYDRYVTTASWVVQTSLIYITNVFRTVKGLLLLAACGLFVFMGLGKDMAMGPAFFVLLAYYAAGLVIWDIAPGRGASNSIFSDSFIGSISGRNPEEIFENHVNTKTARVVKKLRGLYYNALKAH
ncbi:hypothetical protein [Hyphococcus luteus]|uniref:Uncharacterized protein n=1 Tax=Hyphococcus luteus TaxID=2058213 RepID=A0A2S7JYY7_9PROT|nr:hypothetical protein [Marinicaulis flavus]PQA85465.1 hypothetical protein CW354_21205 [Marinicaulis flavus]